MARSSHSYHPPEGQDHFKLAAQLWADREVGRARAAGVERLPAWGAQVNAFLKWVRKQVATHPHDLFWQQVGQVLKRKDLGQIATTILAPTPDLSVDGRRAYVTLYRESPEDGTLEVLLVHPTGKPWRGASYWLPGGTVERGEDQTTAAKREMLEELGIDLGDRRGRPFTDPDHPTLFTLALAADEEYPTEFPERQLQKSEIDWAGFVPYTDAVTQIHPDLRGAVVAAALGRILDLSMLVVRLPRTQAGRHGFEEIRGQVEILLAHPSIPETTRTAARAKFAEVAAEDWTQGAKPRGSSARAPSQVHGQQEGGAPWVKALVAQAREEFPNYLYSAAGLRVRLSTIRPTKDGGSITLAWRGVETDFTLQATFTRSAQHMEVGARSLVSTQHHHTLVGVIKLPWTDLHKPFPWGKMLGRDPWPKLFSRVGVSAKQGWESTPYPTVQPASLHIEQQAALAKVYQEFATRGIQVLEIRREANGRVLVLGGQGSARALVSISVQGATGVIRPPHLGRVVAGDAQVDLEGARARWEPKTTSRKVERLSTPGLEQRITPAWVHSTPHRDRLPGGMADAMQPRDFDATALAAGTRQELEHTNDPHIAREIAMDHLAEDPYCYDGACKEYGWKAPKGARKQVVEKLGVARFHVPKSLYHGTRIQNLPGILSRGVQPAVVAQGFTNNRTKTKTATFLTDKAESALLYAQNSEDVPHAILVVDPSGLDLHPDYDDAAPLISVDLMELEGALDSEIAEALAPFRVGMEIPDEYAEAVEDAIEELREYDEDRPPMSLEVEDGILAAKPYVMMGINTSAMRDDPELYDQGDMSTVDGSPDLLTQQFQVLGPIPLDHIREVYVYPAIPGTKTIRLTDYAQITWEEDEDTGERHASFVTLTYSVLDIPGARRHFGMETARMERLPIPPEGGITIPVVYHQTHAADFDRFDRLAKAASRRGVKIDTVGSWFTTLQTPLYGPKIKAYRLSMRNPKVYRGPAAFQDLYRDVERFTFLDPRWAVAERGAKTGVRSHEDLKLLPWAGVVRLAKRYGVDLPETASGLQRQGPIARLWDKMASDAVELYRAWLDSQGFDGIALLDTTLDTKVQDAYIILHPDQATQVPMGTVERLPAPQTRSKAFETERLPVSPMTLDQIKEQPKVGSDSYFLARDNAWKTLKARGIVPGGIEGQGAFGAVYTLPAYPGVVLKLTLDATDAAVAAWSLGRHARNKALPEYVGVVAFEGGMYGIFREDLEELPLRLQGLGERITEGTVNEHYWGTDPHGVKGFLQAYAQLEPAGVSLMDIRDVNLRVSPLTQTVVVSDAGVAVISATVDVPSTEETNWEALRERLSRLSSKVEAAQRGRYNPAEDDALLDALERGGFKPHEDDGRVERLPAYAPLPASITALDGTRYFTTEALQEAVYDAGEHSRRTIVAMSPQTFLDLALPGKDFDKQRDVNARVEEGRAFNSLPFLSVENDDNGILRVVGHDGRHRARALRDRGVTEMPVVLSTLDAGLATIRWSRPYKGEVWPTRIRSEDKKKILSLPPSLIYPDAGPGRVERLPKRGAGKGMAGQKKPPQYDADAFIDQFRGEHSDVIPYNLMGDRLTGKMMETVAWSVGWSHANGAKKSDFNLLESYTDLATRLGANLRQAWEKGRDAQGGWK